MKKILVVFLLFLSFSLFACTQTDANQEKLDAAKTALINPWSDASNVTSGVSAITKHGNGTVIEWVSSNTNVVTFGEVDAENNTVTAEVERPAYGSGDVKVTITAKLSIESAKDASKKLTDEKKFEITVKELSEDAVVFKSVREMLDYKGAATDITVKVSEATVFALGDDACFIYDGTGITQVYGSGAQDLIVGKVYNIVGTGTWYFGLWEITKGTYTLVDGATPKYPTKQTVNDVSEFTSTLASSGKHLPSSGTKADGNMEPIYATVKGVVTLNPKESPTSNYRFYLVKKDVELVAGKAATETEAAVPANGLMLYYHSLNFAAFSNLVGLELTLDVVIYTYRSNNLAFAFYYVGGANGFNGATLSDADSAKRDADNLSIVSNVIEAGKLTLPATGYFGSTITWESKNTNIIKNDGTVVLPETGQVAVEVVATVKKGAATETKSFIVKVGEPIITKLESILTLTVGEQYVSEGVILWAHTNKKSAVVYDGTGLAYIYTNAEIDIEVGKHYRYEYILGAYNGLYQLTNVTVSAAKSEKPNTDIEAAEWDLEDVNAFMDEEKFTVMYIKMTVTGVKSGSYINGKIDGASDNLYLQTNGCPAALEGKVFEVTGFIIGRRGNSASTGNCGPTLQAIDETYYKEVTE